MVKESKYCSRVTGKHFNKQLVMTEKDNFQSSKKCWIYDNDFFKVWPAFQIIKNAEALDTESVIRVKLSY